MLQTEVRDGIAVVTLCRPDRHNALDDATLHALHSALLDARPPVVRAVVLVGAGGAAFSSGSDLDELASQNLAERVAHTELGQAVADALEAHPALVIAAIEGWCLGGGLELALACDLRIVARQARLGLPEVPINALPSWGATWRLPRMVGSGRAKELILLGRELTADEALAWGLASEVVEPGAALERSRELASALAARAHPETVQRAKELATAGASVDGRVGRQLERLADGLQLSAAAFDDDLARWRARSGGSS